MATNDLNGTLNLQASMEVRNPKNTLSLIFKLILPVVCLAILIFGLSCFLTNSYLSKLLVFIVRTEGFRRSKAIHERVWEYAWSMWNKSICQWQGYPKAGETPSARNYKKLRSEETPSGRTTKCEKLQVRETPSEGNSKWEKRQLGETPSGRNSNWEKVGVGDSPSRQCEWRVVK